MGLLWSADDCVSNIDCAALRALTGPEGESAVLLFVTFGKLLKRCGAIQKFDHPFTFALRRIDRQLSQRHSDCAAWVGETFFFYNYFTPSEFGEN